MSNVEDRMFMRLMAKAREFEATHTKVDVGKARRSFIKENYQRLKLLEEKALIGVKYDHEWVEIRIVAKSITSCSAAPAFINLVSIADTLFIDPCRVGFIIRISISLWRWKEKA